MVRPTGADVLKDIEARELQIGEKLLQLRKHRLTFAVDYHINTRGEKMEFANYPHIRELYNSLAREIVLQGSVQCFKSEWAVIDHFAAAYSGLSVFYVLAKYESRNTYVQNRINRCVEQVPEYKKIIGRGFFDNIALKSFGTGVVKYVGSNVLSDFKEFPADMIIIDEVDECDPTNIQFALDRMRASQYQFIRRLGNPKIRGKGINKFFLMSDQREWEVPCKQCDEYAEMDWFKTVVSEVVDQHGNIIDYTLRDTDWAIGCRRDVRAICPACGGELDRTSQEGRWVPRNPGHPVHGYHISMLCAPINPISGMWDRFQKAMNDPGLLKQFFNSDLGLPYSSAGNKVTTTVLDRCVDESYEFAIRPNAGHVKADSDTGPCSMGIDVGANFDVRISRLGARGQRRAVYIGKVRASNIDELYDLIDRYNVEKAVMDAGPELMLAQDFQDTANCDVWLCRYHPNEGSDRKRTFQIHDRVVSIDRTEALDRSYAQIKKKKNILPFNYQSILDGKFVTEICVPVRQITEDAKGNSRYEWTKGVDHCRHSDTYDMLAAGLLMDVTIDDVSIG
jgi:hypothetical protein